MQDRVQKLWNDEGLYRPVISTRDIAWTTGLLEGEGTFGMSGRSITISVRMTDRDIIERAAEMLGGYSWGPQAPRMPHHKPQWRAQIKGPRAAAWMMTMYALLGVRRRSQVRRALDGWRAMRYLRISLAIRRAIIESWDAGFHTKTDLARRFEISRKTIYQILFDHQRISGVREVSASDPLIDLAWLAGLFEGEGSVSINGKSMTVRICMTDQDIVYRAAEIMRAKVYRRRDRPGYRPQWIAQTKGAPAAGIIMTLYPWLGIRRREQARTALAAWKRQGHGVVAGTVADAIIEYRKAGYSQADIMDLFKVGKSTVYRHTKDHVRRMHVTTHRPILRLTTPPTP